MEFVLICTVALVTSGLTLFSGFGLGTLLMPAFALFFPVPLAIAATAVVHLANNIFKVVLVGKNTNWDVIARFALPGAVAAIAGAALLDFFAQLPILLAYSVGGREYEITVVKGVIGLLIVVFALLEMVPRLSKLTFERNYLILGGLLSGFFGGLSGNQGALRSAFLIKSGLDKEAFISTAAVSTVIVDIARLLAYGWAFYTAQFHLIGSEIGGVVFAATLAAFLGAFLGARLIKKVTLRTIQLIVGCMLILVGLGMATGLL